MNSRRRLQGVVTIVQESRFRLQDGEGRGYIFTLRAGLDAGQVRRYAQDATPVTVIYSGRPDIGAVATSVRPTGTTLVG